MNPFYLVLIFCGAAVLALLVNIKKKLPKYVFLFFSVAIVVSVSWYTMLNEEKYEDPKPSAVKEPFVFTEVSKFISVNPGKTKISIPTFFSGKRGLDCVRLVFESLNSDLTEQAFLENVDFLLLSSGGILLPATGIQFLTESESRFPGNFILKTYFALPENLSTSAFSLIIENKSGLAFRVAEISVASSPFLEK